MKFPRTRQPEKIFKAAIGTLGEDAAFVLWYLKINTGIKKINWRGLSVDEWFHLCRLLYLDINCIFYGYDKKDHLIRIMESLKSRTYHWSRIPDEIVTINTQIEF
ncbi:MAG: hypothetical protein HYV97_03665 [Bdellovibrio sp.]|nr:hypothetical protein [Bdellovibrio sp.]